MRFVWLAVVGSLRLREEEEDGEVLDADSQKLQEAVEVVKSFCLKYKSGEVQDDNEPRRQARDFCD